MSKNEIITELYNQHFIERVVCSLCKGISTDKIADIVSELYLKLCEKSAEQIERLYNDKQLEFFAIAICKYQIYNKHNIIYKLLLEQREKAFADIRTEQDDL